MSDRFILDEQGHVTEALVRTAATRDDLEGTRAFFEKRLPRLTDG